MDGCLTGRATASPRVWRRRRAPRTPHFLISFAVTALLGASAKAATDEPTSAYQLSVDVDLPLLLLGTAVPTSYLFRGETAPPACAPLCDRNNVNFFDRPFAGNYSVAWQNVGTVATAATLVLVPLSLIIEEPSRGGLGDLLVVAETILITATVQVPVSYAVDRPRPLAYGEKAPISLRESVDAGQSFFSGHSANCVTVTLATTRALRRIGHRGLAWAVLGFGLVGSALVGISRIESGYHFPSDVLAGYAVGASVGIAIPAAHEVKVVLAPLATPTRQGLSIAVAF